MTQPTSRRAARQSVGSLNRSVSGAPSTSPNRLPRIAHPERSDDLSAAIDEACARIAPAWPLDRLIAVNPYWGYVDQPIELAASRLGTLVGTSLVMPRAWYRSQLAEGDIDDLQLQRASVRTKAGYEPPALHDAMGGADPMLREYPLLADLADELRDDTHHVTWRDYVVQDVSAACGAFFGAAQARWSPDTSHGLYVLWRQLASRNAEPRLLLGQRGVGGVVRSLPQAAMPLIEEAIGRVDIPRDEWATYFTALLMRVSGWASVCAHRRWEARLRGDDDQQLVELLAVQLAWELVLLRLYRTSGIAVRRQYARDAWRGAETRLYAEQRAEWAVQTAIELAYQRQLTETLRDPNGERADAPSAQLVFCIDVRSEVMRRAVETVAPSARTIGFAGFFGLPIAYGRPDSETRAQLPGLLAPTMTARDAGAGAEAIANRRRWREQWSSAWSDAFRNASSAFGAIEATGVGYLGALLGRALGGSQGSLDPSRGDVLSHRSRPAVAPRLAEWLTTHEPVDVASKVQLAAAILRGMSLTRDFAPLLVLVGHGAATTNNPQAAALACGACGGQAGEVNARVLAAMLNEPEVRRGLSALGICLPSSTHVLAGLHDTVTDSIALFDVDHVPLTHRDDVRVLATALEGAGTVARRERAPRLGLGALVGDPDRLRGAMERRGADWSEVRPEWGLARNAALIVARRSRTRGRSLDGRAFLHDYVWEDDPTTAVLAQILTAPMVVAHWINMQYYASTVDPRRFGSGDKVLHDVAGAHVGVFEGAGGDLRIGLAEQSLHDGTQWVHVPLRLTVIVEAPQPAIDAVIDAHPVVRNLVLNGWVHLLQLEGEQMTFRRRSLEGWEAMEG